MFIEPVLGRPSWRGAIEVQWAASRDSGSAPALLTVERAQHIAVTRVGVIQRCRRPGREAPEFVDNAAKRGIFASFRHDGPDQMRGALDVALRRCAEFSRARGARSRRALIVQAKES